ncbi:hypothetical protein H6G00_00805 [Leptolyngbya sp. FACHB-541]|uniref:hypothetical protein n=1 Tax=Leptolyngbya sp. FACHB-541 TaxID=2692810 RepID=UPI001687D545|nr:hypothetical protein [Leptolyngbya sp. FACHB-541]MBD1995167.1 hypothetical protein [Leptolyngbya sp. FACHB-541]
MSYHIVRVLNGQVIGTLSPVSDPEAYQWDESEVVEVFDNQEAFDVRLEQLRQAAEPKPEDLPRWDDFQNLMLMNSNYLRIVGASSATLVYNSTLIWILGEIGKHPERLPHLINVWNAIAYIARPTPEEIESLNKVCVATNMRFWLNERGFMVAV